MAKIVRLAPAVVRRVRKDSGTKGLRVRDSTRTNRPSRPAAAKKRTRVRADSQPCDGAWVRA